MSKVSFTYSVGRERMMSRRDAEILQKLGRGTYSTRDMVAALAQRAAPVVGDGLDGLDAEELHAMAKQRGVRVHHNAGAEKVRAALREAAE